MRRTFVAHAYCETVKPNGFSDNPVLAMRLDLGNLAGRESFEFSLRCRSARWVHRGCKAAPTCRTWSSTLPSNCGKTVRSGTPGVYTVAVDYKCEAGMRKLLQTAVDLVEAVLRNGSFDLAASVREARAVLDSRAPIVSITGAGASPQSRG